MDYTHKQYIKATGLVILLILISFCINAAIINPFDTLPNFINILMIVAGILSCFVLFKSRAYLAQTDSESLGKILLSVVVSVSLFTSFMFIFQPQIKSLIVSKKYDDYYVRIAADDRNHPAYYHFAVARSKNSERYLVNFEKNYVMLNFMYLSPERQSLFEEYIKNSRDKNLIKLYEELNKDNKLNLKEVIQLQEFINKYGVHNEKPPF